MGGCIFGKAPLVKSERNNISRNIKHDIDTRLSMR